MLKKYCKTLSVSLIVWKSVIWRISCISMLSMTKQLICKLEFYNPSQARQCPNSIRGGSAENLGYWPSPHKRNEGCVKSFAVNCAHKCNFLTFLLQQNLPYWWRWISNCTFEFCHVTKLKSDSLNITKKYWIRPWLKQFLWKIKPDQRIFISNTIINFI